MKILLTNDDGIHGEGIHALASALKEAGHEILIVAPSMNNSAVSHKLTMREAIPIEKRSEDSYAVGGTPADCVLVALKYLKFLPELILSGINMGMNVGSDVLYSGTVAGALEGAQNGIPSIALSQFLRNNSMDEVKMYFCRAAKYTAEHLEEWVVLARQTAALNVNFPLGEPQGVRICRQAKTLYEMSYTAHEDGLHLTCRSPEEAGEGDIPLLKAGYITITPLGLNMTDFDAIDRWGKGA